MCLIAKVERRGGVPFSGVGEKGIYVDVTCDEFNALC